MSVVRALRIAAQPPGKLSHLFAIGVRVRLDLPDRGHYRVDGRSSRAKNVHAVAETDMSIDATDQKETHEVAVGEAGRASPVCDSNRATSSTANSGSCSRVPPEIRDASCGSSVSLPTTLTGIPA